MLRKYGKSSSSKNTWYRLGRFAGDAFIWAANKLKPAHSSGSEDLDRLNNMYVDAVADQMTRELIEQRRKETADWQRYDYFDANHPTQGVYAGRYAYDPRHNRNTPSDSMSNNAADWFTRGFSHESTPEGDYRFQDLENGNIVLFSKNNLPFSTPPSSTASKKLLPKDPLGVENITGGYRPTATFGVRRPDADLSSAALMYDPIAARAQEMLRRMTPNAHSTIPQAARYQVASEPVIEELAADAPLPPVAYSQRASEPIIEFPDDPKPSAQYQSRKTTRPELATPVGPIRKRPRSHAVAQEEPFDYVSYLSRLASTPLYYNFPRQ